VAAKRSFPQVLSEPAAGVIGRLLSLIQFQPVKESERRDLLEYAVGAAHARLIPVSDDGDPAGGRNQFGAPSGLAPLFRIRNPRLPRQARNLPVRPPKLSSIFSLKNNLTTPPECFTILQEGFAPLRARCGPTGDRSTELVWADFLCRPDAMASLRLSSLT
jgi:hypothetical protein